MFFMYKGTFRVFLAVVTNAQNVVISIHDLVTFTPFLSYTHYLSNTHNHTHTLSLSYTHTLTFLDSGCSHCTVLSHNLWESVIQKSNHVHSTNFFPLFRVLKNFSLIQSCLAYYLNFQRKIPELKLSKK